MRKIKTVVILITLFVVLPKAAAAWDESDLAGAINNISGIGSNGHQYTTGNTFKSEDGWTTKIMQSGQNLVTVFEMPDTTTPPVDNSLTTAANQTNTGSVTNQNPFTENGVTITEIMKWQEYDNPISFEGGSGSGFQRSAEISALRMEINNPNGTNRLFTDLETALTQSMEFNDGSGDPWGTKRSTLNQVIDLSVLNNSPGNTEISHNSVIEQGFNRESVINGANVTQGAWQKTTAIINGNTNLIPDAN